MMQMGDVSAWSNKHLVHPEQNIYYEISLQGVEL